VLAADLPRATMPFLAGWWRWAVKVVAERVGHGCEHCLSLGRILAQSRRPASPPNSRPCGRGTSREGRGSHRRSAKVGRLGDDEGVPLGAHEGDEDLQLAVQQQPGRSRIAARAEAESILNSRGWPLCPTSSDLNIGSKS
jgi:hypothetical protein